MITAALPTYRNADIIWLQLESLCRQVDAPEWELIVCEEPSEKRFGADALAEYGERLKAVNCMRVRYIELDAWMPLGQKWVTIRDHMHIDSIGMMLCASDNWSPPRRIRDAYAAMRQGHDWHDTQGGMFYDIVNHRAAMYDLKAYPDKSGLFMCVSRAAMQKVKRTDYPKRGIDGWIKKQTGSNNPHRLSPTPSGIHTDGLNTISLHRTELYTTSDLYTPTNADEVFAMFPADIRERLAVYRKAPAPFFKVVKVAMPQPDVPEGGPAAIDRDAAHAGERFPDHMRHPEHLRHPAPLRHGGTPGVPGTSTATPNDAETIDAPLASPALHSVILNDGKRPDLFHLTSTLSKLGSVSVADNATGVNLKKYPFRTPEKAFAREEWSRWWQMAFDLAKASPATAYLFMPSDRPDALAYMNELTRMAAAKGPWAYNMVNNGRPYIWNHYTPIPSMFDPAIEQVNFVDGAVVISHAAMQALGWKFPEVPKSWHTPGRSSGIGYYLSEALLKASVPMYRSVNAK